MCQKTTPKGLYVRLKIKILTTKLVMQPGGTVPHAIHFFNQFFDEKSYATNSTKKSHFYLYQSVVAIIPIPKSQFLIPIFTALWSVFQALFSFFRIVFIFGFLILIRVVALFPIPNSQFPIPAFFLISKLITLVCPFFDLYHGLNHVWDQVIFDGTNLVCPCPRQKMHIV